MTTLITFPNSLGEFDSPFPLTPSSKKKIEDTLSGKTVPISYIHKVARDALITSYSEQREALEGELEHTYEPSSEDHLYQLKTTCENLSDAAKKRFEALQKHFGKETFSSSNIYNAIFAVSTPFTPTTNIDTLANALIEQQDLKENKSNSQKDQFEDDIFLKTPEKTELYYSLLLNGVSKDRANEVAKIFQNKVYLNSITINKDLEKHTTNEEKDSESISQGIKASLICIPADKYSLTEESKTERKISSFIKMPTSKTIDLALYNNPSTKQAPKLNPEGFSKLAEFIALYFGSKCYEKKKDLQDNLEEGFRKKFNDFPIQKGVMLKQLKLFSNINIQGILEENIKQLQVK